MNAKHTQGQWSWYEHGKTDTSPVKVETKDQVIAEVVYKTDHEERIANARLIAAAPELLDAAKAVLQIWDDLYYNQSDPEEREAWNTLRAAIAKAEGADTVARDFAAGVYPDIAPAGHYINMR